MLTACARILKVCVCVQLGCVCILVPRNPNSSLLAYVSLFYLLNMPLFCLSFLYVYDSASMCCCFFALCMLVRF